MEIARRGLITGLISLMAAPAVVQASSLMPIRGFRLLPPQNRRGAIYYDVSDDVLKLWDGVKWIAADPLMANPGPTKQRLRRGDRLYWHRNDGYGEILLGDSPPLHA